ncbi:unnamed protein product [Enterobius vermicularis]|uniref:DUF148 domain-containing protein n=1 Tax=Enterobius vermicularis TaxID=51028 RepID=A0A0N4VM67_ENTVE|nr:unnamed protein product [Enterobius vermicularis]
MRLFIFFAILTIAYAGGDIFAIRDLIPMLTNWTDRAQLEVLMRDQTTPRSQIQAQVQEIVARQSEDVQNAYRILYENRQNQIQQWNQRRLQRIRNRGSKQNCVANFEEMTVIMNDLSLSQSQVDERIQELYSKPCPMMTSTAAA